MNPNQPPGWGPPPGGQGGGFGAPGQGAFGPPAQGAFGQPQAPYGQPPQSAFGQAPAPHGQPPPPGYAQPQPGYGQPPAYGQPPGAFGQPAPGALGSGTFGPPQPASAMGPARKLGLFESMPCPHCGAGMRTSTGYGAAVAGRMVGGLVGWLLVRAIASKYYCPTHGEIPREALPEEHRKLATMRRLMMVGGAAMLFVFATALICVVSALR